MSSAVITNFKNMILLVGKVGSSDPSCPMNDKLLGTFIDYLFKDQGRVASIPVKYKENRIKLDKIYREQGSSYEQMLKDKDRSVFRQINLFPDNVSKQYQPFITWFSDFLVDKMEDRHMDYIWAYIEKIDKQLAPK